MGALDSPMRQLHHPTVKVLTVSTVGALTSWGTGQSGVAPDKNCSLSGASSGAALTLRKLFVHCSRCRRPLESTVALASRCSAGTPDSPVPHQAVRCHTRQSGATPDSLVNNSRVASEKPEGEEFRLYRPGAPDTVRWHTGQSGAPEQGSLRFPLLLSVEP